MTTATTGAAQSAMAALLWSSTDDNGSPLDDAEPSAELTAVVARDWERFIAAAEAAGFDPELHRTGPINSAEGDATDYAAHDFILTRNRHGAGFWDGGWAAPWSDRLTKLAHQFGELDLYRNPDTEEAELYSDPDNNPGPFEQYLLIEECQTGELSAIELGPDDPLDLETLVDRWVAERFGGELMRDGELMPKLQGDFYATIHTDWRPLDSVVVWESGGFYLRDAS